MSRGPVKKSENPRIELQPETIQKMIAEDAATWTRLVDQLHDAAVPALKAIDAKNAKGLFDAGEHMEHACEACHQQYWYPPAAASAWKHEPGGRIPDESAVASVQAGKGGTIKGHIGVKGKVPGNAVIRMGMDPKCAALNAGKRPSRRSSLPALTAAWRMCSSAFRALFLPRRSSGACHDRSTRLHVCASSRRGAVDRRCTCGTATSCSTTSTDFRTRQRIQRQPAEVRDRSEFRLKEPEIMVRVTCDVHRWMTAFVGVVITHTSRPPTRRRFHDRQRPRRQYTIQGLA